MNNNNNKNKKTIMLVEDEYIIAYNEKSMLENYGYNVIIVNNGEKAIETVQNNKAIDLILMDIDLGKGLDGTATAKIILKEIDIPVVFLSSHIEKNVVEKTEKITSYGYILKNSSITVIDASVKMAFKLFESRKKAQVKSEELRKSQNRFQNILESAPYGYYRVGKDEKWEYVNKKWEELHHYNRNEIIGKHFSITQPKEYLKEATTNVKRVLSGETIIGEFARKTKTGEIKYHSFNIQPVFENNEITAVEGFINDITIKKIFDEEQKKSYDRLITVLNSINANIYVADINNYEILFVNDFGKQEWGNCVGKKCFEVIQSKRDKPCSFCSNKKLLQIKDLPDNISIWTYKKDEKWFECQDKIISWIDNREVRISVIRDITNLKEKEEKIKFQKNELQLLNEKLETTNEELSATNEELQNTNEKLETTNEELSATNEELRNTNEELAATNEELHNTNEELAATNEELHNTNQELAATNEELHNTNEELETTNEELSATNEELHNTSKELQISNEKFQTTNEELKKINNELETTNKKLNESEKKFRLLAENISAMVYMCENDSKWTTHYVNNAAEKITGYSKELLLNNTISYSDLYHPDDRDMVYSEVNRTLKKFKPFRLVYRIIHSNGSVKWVEEFVDTVKKEGDIQYLVGFITDITESKNTQKRIQSLLNEKEMLLNETHHRIKNNMIVLRSILSMESDMINEHPNCQKVLNECSSRIMSMMTLYDYLYRNEITDKVDVSFYLENLISKLLVIHKEIEIKTEIDIENVFLKPKIMTSVGLIINELFTNSVKHAFDKSVLLKISIILKRNNDKINLIFSDNGKGLKYKESLKNSETFGLKLIDMLVYQIEGNIKIDTENGTKYIIEFKR